jgi:hypothetical protein
MSDVTKMMLQSPEFARVLDNGVSVAAAVVPVSVPDDGVTSTKKRKKKKKNKKKKAEDVKPTVLRPRNFLEAALYFSSITMSTVEMAAELDPEYFFAPPLLFQSAEGTESWLQGLKRQPKDGPTSATLAWEQHKAVQRRAVGLFAVALLQTAQHMKPSGEGRPTLSSRSNYLKRTIGLYAISLVDHLPPSLTCRLGDAEKGLGVGLNGNIQGAARNLFRGNPLLANRKLELNDLKVPSPLQLSDYWSDLPNREKAFILRSEQTNLLKGWINVKRTWCLCKYCRTRALRLGDVYDLVYRAYYDDLERVAGDLDGKSADANNTLKGKTLKQLFRSLSLLADDVSEERPHYLAMVLKRLGRAFEEDDTFDWDDCTHGEVNTCCCGHKSHTASSNNNTTGAKQSTTTHSQPHSNEPLDEYSDEEDVPSEECDSWDEDHDDEDDEIFYEDFNMQEDEEVIQAECELPLDTAHLPTSFPQLYDPRMYTLPRPAVPANNIVSETDRIADGMDLYERLASLLFQFHLVPRYLEKEALERQKRLLEEEEEEEKREKERAEVKAAAKQRRKERQKEAKKKLKEEQEQALRVAEDDTIVIMDEGLEVKVEIEKDSIFKVKEVAKDNNDDDGEEDEVEPVSVEMENFFETPKEPIINDTEVDTCGEDVPPGLDFPSSCLSVESVSSPLESYDSGHPPPGLSNQHLTPRELSGEAPVNLPATWFDQILGPSLWSPLATSKLEDGPPGFGFAAWSPFARDEADRY